MMFLAVQPALMPLHADDADQERSSREEELYEEATDSLDEGDYRDAASKFRQVANMNGENAAAALHWLAYSQNKMGQRSEALATLVDLQKRYPKSKWASDGKALEVEVRQSAGQTVAPDRVDDEDLKLMVVNGLMHSDPARAFPILKGIISGNYSPKLKDKALFVLSQSGSPEAMQLLGQIARDNANPELQSRAIRNLGIIGGDRSRQILAEVYGSATDKKVKRSILKSYMISGDRGRLLSLAKSEADPDLRADAVQQLGIIGAKDELSQLYTTETAIPVRKKIIQAMFIGGNADKLAELARNEKVLELRLAAIKNLGLMGGRSGDFLVQMYESDPSHQVRDAVINGLFLQGNAKALVGLARKEKDRELKKEIVSKLSLMNSEEGSQYLLELLNE
jgi:tetratricopeptide (TPR) repeat protein